MYILKINKKHKLRTNNCKSSILIFLILFSLFTVKSAFSQIYTPELDSAYHLLSQKKIKEAIPLFEQHIKDYPQDTKVYMQLAYIYDSEGQYAKSYQYFHYVSINSTDPDEKEQATASASIMKDKMNQYAKRTLDVGLQSYYDTYQKNVITSLTMYYKFMVSKQFYIGPYLDVYTDSRSTPTLVYNDRYLELGFFARFYMIPQLYFETRIGYVHDFNSDSAKININPRLVFGTRVGDGQSFIGDHPAKRTSFFVDFYGALSYDYKFKNGFFQAGIQEVFRNNLSGYSYLDFFLVEYLTLDSRRLDYNNLVEAGPGVKFKPNFRYFPELFIEATYKKYFFGTPPNSFQVKLGFSLNFTIKG